MIIVYKIVLGETFPYHSDENNKINDKKYVRKMLKPNSKKYCLTKMYCDNN